jgi:hypothetical protein
MTLLRTARPKARKRHRCDACERWIQPGTVYVAQAYVDDYGPYTWRTHAECAAELERHTPDDDGHPYACLSGRYYDDLSPAFVAWRDTQDRA